MKPQNMDLIALTQKGEIIARDEKGLYLSISGSHITKHFGDWIEIYISNDSDLGQKLKRGH